MMNKRKKGRRHPIQFLIRQKSRHKWVREYDLNPRYFHSIMRSRRKRNVIVTINTNMGMVEKVE